MIQKQNNKYSTVEAWNLLLQKYNILEEIKNNEIFYLKASQIREFREPRLMAKWDSSEQLPKPLKENNINILPVSRKLYVLGEFLLYEKIPPLTEHVKQMTAVELPKLETIDINNISSEANAINVLIISKILDDFLDTDENIATFNGKMNSGRFDFKVNTFRGNKAHIYVDNAQIEIDGGFENDKSVVILEAKNVLHEDFHIRQLYYPYRLWMEKVDKPIRCVFSIYTNKIFRLFEYKFVKKEDYSSIKLIKAKNYSLENTDISLEDIKNVYNKVVVKYDDDMSKQLETKENIPFVQADSFDRVISLLENMHNNYLRDSEIAELMHFGFTDQNGNITYRQSQYYYNAGKYLGLFEKIKDDDKKTVSKLTKLGEDIYNMDYRERQLTFVYLMLEHQIFYDIFRKTLDDGEIPSIQYISCKMEEMNVCRKPQIKRRAQTVKSWINWIFNLVNL